jgi:hypothetical protein
VGHDPQYPTHHHCTAARALPCPRHAHSANNAHSDTLTRLHTNTNGINTRSIYIYGEAWDFGEVLNNARGRNCGQMNLSGAGGTDCLPWPL